VRIFLQSDHIRFPFLLGRTEITWINSDSGGPIPEADLYIWEYTPELGLDSCVLGRPSAHHLVLAEPKYIDALGPVHNSVCVLLKPVTPFTLNAFVELAFNNWEARQQARELEALRLDRDALLEYVLQVNLRLQEYDHARSNFLARALHDFCAPLTALHGYCGLLAEGRLGRISAVQRAISDPNVHAEPAGST
jgi:signal transduction histidine kinase